MHIPSPGEMFFNGFYLMSEIILRTAIYEIISIGLLSNQQRLQPLYHFDSKKTTLRIFYQTSWMRTTVELLWSYCGGRAELPAMKTGNIRDIMSTQHHLKPPHSEINNKIHNLRSRIYYFM